MSECVDDIGHGDKVSICVEDKLISCSKAVLTQKSEYFRAMFDSNMIETQTREVTLHDQKYDLVKALIVCMETDKLKIGDNVLDLLQTAVMLQTQTAIDSCVSYLLSTLDSSNCFHMMTVAQTYMIHKLYNHAKRHSLYYFKEVAQQSELLKMDGTKLIKYLSDKHLNTKSELNVLNAIHYWYVHDAKAREDNLPAVLQCFHPEDLLKREWEDLVKHDIIKDTQAGKEWFKGIENMEKETRFEGQYRELPVMFLTVGGIVEINELALVQTDICKFDEQDKTFKPFLNLKDVFPECHPKMGFRVTVLGKDLYITGGQADLRRSNYNMDVWRLDGFDLTWKVVTSLPSPRRHHGACASDTSLYLLGGFGKYRDILDTVDQYDVVNGGSILGGNGIYRDILDTVDQYDVVNDVWCELPKMPKRCFTPQATVCNNRLYVYKNPTIICYNFDTSEWTNVYSADRLEYISIQPKPFDNLIFEFPYFDMELDWFYEFEELDNLVCEIYDTENDESTSIEMGKTVQFGNMVTVCNRRFYLLNRYDKKFASCSLDDFVKMSDLGTKGSAGADSFLVTLPCYPEYKVTCDVTLNN